MQFMYSNRYTSHAATLAIATTLLLNACGGSGNDSTVQDAVHQPTALTASLSTKEYSLNNSSSKNSSQDSITETTTSSSSSSSGAVDNSPTLASCYSPMPGKQFTSETLQETSYSSPSTAYTTNTISAGTYLGKDVIIESFS